MMFFGTLLTLLGLGGLAYALGWRPEDLERIGQGRRSDEDPVSILKKRYARGDISREEYMAMKEDLA